MEGFGLVMGTDLTVTGLSEEHGVIELPVASDWPRIGERLRIIPNHACVISNLFDSVTLISGDEVREVVPVAARGRVD
jgi:D-serine deaminase-like pyridoxal phosphate-dependent protein